MEVQMSNNYIILDGVIRQGLDLMRQPNISREQFFAWVGISKNALGQISKNPIFMTNYLSVVLAASNPNLTPNQGFSMCLRYLIEILPVI